MVFSTTDQEQSATLEDSDIQKQLSEALLNPYNILFVIAAPPTRSTARSYLTPLVNAIKALSRRYERIDEVLRPRVIVLAETQTLAQQVYDEASDLTKSPHLITVALASWGTVENKVNSNAEILVATREKLAGLVVNRLLDLGDLDWLVVDGVGWLLNETCCRYKDNLLGAPYHGPTQTIFVDPMFLDGIDPNEFMERVRARKPLSR